MPLSTMSSLHNFIFIYSSSQVKTCACCLGFLSGRSNAHDAVEPFKFVFPILNNAKSDICQKCSEVTLSIVLIFQEIFHLALCHH